MAFNVVGVLIVSGPVYVKVVPVATPLLSLGVVPSVV
jgi:hypothetical protein